MKWSVARVALIALMMIVLTPMVGAQPGVTTIDDGETDGWRWTGSRILAVDFEVDPVIAQEWLPAGVTMADPAVATIFVAHYPEAVCCGEYYETTVILHVEHSSGATRHCPWMLVDNDLALVRGRDVLGFPKKMGDISLNIDQKTGQVDARVERLGTTLIEMSGTLGAVDPDPPSIFGHRWVNVWGVNPHRSQQGLVNGPRLLLLDIIEQNVRTVQADLEVTIRGSVNDPIDEIRPGKVLGARLHIANVYEGTEPPPFAGGEVSMKWFERTRALRYD